MRAQTRAPAPSDRLAGFTKLIVTAEEAAVARVEALGDSPMACVIDLCAVMLLAARLDSGRKLDGREHHVSVACAVKLIREGITDLDFQRKLARVALLSAVAPQLGIERESSDRLCGEIIARLGVVPRLAPGVIEQGRARIAQLWARVERRRGQLAEASEEVRGRLAPLLPEGLALAQHQLEALAKIESRGWKTILGDDRGLGKTVECVATALLHGEGAFPLLICSPSSMVGTWAWESRRWLAHLRPRVVIDEELVRVPVEERQLRAEVTTLRDLLRASGPSEPALIEALRTIPERYEEAGRYCEVQLVEEVHEDEAIPEEERVTWSLTFRANRDRKEGTLGNGCVHERLVERLQDDVEMVAERVRQGHLRHRDSVLSALTALKARHVEAAEFCAIRFGANFVPWVHVKQDLLAQWLRRPLVICVSWTRMIMELGMLNQVGFGGVVGDEAHEALRVWDSRASRAFLSLRQGARVVIPATGTLTPNGRHAEAYTPLRAVDAEVGRFRTYGKRYCGPKPMRVAGGKTITTYKGRTDEIGFATLLMRHGVARKKAEVDQGLLPEKVRHRVMLSLSGHEHLLMAMERDRIRGELQRRAEELRRELWAEGTVTEEAVEERVKQVLRAETVMALSALRIQAGLIKVDRVVPLVRELLEAGERPILVCNHRAVVEKAREVFGALVEDGEIIVADGSVAGARGKQRVCSAWQAGEGELMILTSAFGSGVTLTSSRVEVFIERFWEPGIEDQIEDRIHRMGQDLDCTLYYPHLEGTPDDVMSELSTWKTRGAEASVGSIQERAMTWLKLDS